MPTDDPARNSIPPQPLWAGAALLTALWLVTFGPSPSQASRQDAAATKDQTATNGSNHFELELAAIYEHQQLWKEAEAHYLAAGKTATGPDEQRALAGVTRVRLIIDSDPNSFELRLGSWYESHRFWKEAQEQYAAASKNESAAVRSAALEGLRRTKWKEAWSPEGLEAAVATSVTNLAKATGALLSVLIVIVALCVLGEELRRAYLQIEISPFDPGGDDATVKRLAILFPLQRTRLKALESKPSTQILHDVTFLVAPDWKETFPETVEVSGVKLPLADLLKLLLRPRMRVRGGVETGSAAKSIYAEIWRRRRWFSYFPATFAIRQIPAGAAADRQLELFVYDVLLKVKKYAATS